MLNIWLFSKKYMQLHGGEYKNLSCKAKSFNGAKNKCGELVKNQEIWEEIQWNRIKKMRFTANLKDLFSFNMF